MSLKQYLILIAIGSIAGWVAWITVLFNINPFESGFVGFLLFYVSFALALLGTLSLFGFVIRMWIFHNEDIVLRQVATAFRQACFLTIIFVGSLLLQSQNLLRVWNVLILIISMSILELFLVTSKRTRI